MQALTYVCNHIRVNAANEIYKEKLITQTLEELTACGATWDESYSGADTTLSKEFNGELNYKELVKLATKLKETSFKVRLN